MFYDSTHWVSKIPSSLGIKSVCYNVVCAASIAIAFVPVRNVTRERDTTEEELANPLAGYPSSNVILHKHEARNLLFISKEFGDGITFYERITTGFKKCNVIAIRTCRKLEGNFCDYLASQYKKPVFLMGPVLPEPEESQLEARWSEWLGQFAPGSVIFCAFGSQFILDKDQFQELLSGFESTGQPFLLALKPPTGCSTVEEAFPEGFEERVKGRGVVYGDTEHKIDGWRVEGCCRSVKGREWLGVKGELVQSYQGSGVGSIVREKHAKWREILVSQGFMSGCIDSFIKDLEGLLV
ncbi:hypothetical protein Droror1_Dr00019992 [Drosera rotundifolia]